MAEADKACDDTADKKNSPEWLNNQLVMGDIGADSK